MPFGTAYEILARKAFYAGVAAERERCANACKAVEAKYEASGWQYANDLADVADECGRGISGPNARLSGL